MTRDAFRRQGPFVGSGGLFDPGPATAALLSLLRDNRWMTLSRHPEPSPVHDRFTPAESDSHRPFASRCPPTYHRRRSPRARPPFTPAATLFGALRVSVFEARRSLSISATYFLRRAGTATRALDSRRDEGRNPLPFLNALRGPCGCGNARRAALRPFDLISVPVPPTCVGLPDRDVTPNAPPTRVAPT